MYALGKKESKIFSFLKVYVCVEAKLSQVEPSGAKWSQVDPGSLSLNS